MVWFTSEDDRLKQMLDVEVKPRQLMFWSLWGVDRVVECLLQQRQAGTLMVAKHQPFWGISREGKDQNTRR